MRLDKYLKITRLIKRRTIANEACDAGKIVVNDKIARASYDVKVGDIIEINMGSKPLKVKVLNVNTISVKGKEVRRGKTTGKTSDWKKAIVTIDTNPGDIKYLDKGGKEVKVSKKYKDSIEHFMGA